MARIRVPKPFMELWGEVNQDKLIDLLVKYRVTDSQGKYFHWNDFQWRVQQGDDEIGAWVATKFARRSISKKLPLKADGDINFSYCVPDPLIAQLHAIDRKTGGGRELSDGNFMSLSEKNHYLVKSLMQEEAITSSQLEGASTTREVAKEMLKKNLPPKDKSQQMILNNYRLMKKAIERKDEELSIELILELHKIATYNAIENYAIPGELRNSNNICVTDIYGENPFYPPNYTTLKDRLVCLCEFINRDHVSDRSNFIHPIIKAVILHFMIAYIHPFGDGNGRTARALFYWSIIRSDYWLFEYVSISKLIKEKRGDYDKAFLYTETDEFDLTYFIYNQVVTIEKAVDSLCEYIDKKKRDFDEFSDWIYNSPVAKALKRFELEILKEALRQPGREFTAKQVAVDFSVTENTARSYLGLLVKKDLLIKAKSKSDKTLLYISPANLKSRLKL